MKKKLFVVMCAMFVFALCSCGKKELTPEDVCQSIQWELNESIVDGERCMGMTYENGTPFKVVQVTVEFKNGFTCSGNKIVNPGESSAPAAVNDGWDYIDPDKCAGLEPEYMAVGYIDGENIRLVYMNYTNGACSEDSNSPIKARSWSDSEFAKAVPEPDAEVIRVVQDNEEAFKFSVYGIDRAFYVDYIKQCEMTGYGNDVFGFMPTDRDFISGTDALGHGVMLAYDRYYNTMTCSIRMG